MTDHHCTGDDCAICARRIDQAEDGRRGFATKSDEEYEIRKAEMRYERSLGL